MSDLNSQSSELLAKILLIGDSAVGKTSVMTRFVDNEFPKSHISTIGVDFKIKRINLTVPDPEDCNSTMNHSVKLQLWDTAGQERYKTLSDSYYRGTHGAVLIYDINCRQTFLNLTDSWHPKLKEQVERQSVYMILGNKKDRASTDREVSEQEGRDLALQLNALFFEVSAKLSNNDENDKSSIKYAMNCLCHQIIINFGNECSKLNQQQKFVARSSSKNSLDFGSSHKNLLNGSSIYSGNILNETTGSESQYCCGIYFPFSLSG
ncbi:MAG: hypothetical protein MHMPM18_002194 [Marteilia pararefringens]